MPYSVAPWMPQSVAPLDAPVRGPGNGPHIAPGSEWDPSFKMEGSRRNLAESADEGIRDLTSHRCEAPRSFFRAPSRSNGWLLVSGTALESPLSVLFCLIMTSSGRPRFLPASSGRPRLVGWCLLRVVALAILMAGAAQAQWLDTTLYLGVGSDPCALVYDSVNNKVYCANAGSSNVTVIDGASNQVIATVAAGSRALRSVLQPAGQQGLLRERGQRQRDRD